MSKDTCGAGILALDLGTTTGWACAAPNHLGFGFKAFSRSKAKKEHHGHQFRAFTGWLKNDLIPQIPGGIQAISFELVGFGEGAASQQMGNAWRCCVLMVCAEHGYAYHEVTPGTWKKLVVGKGNAKKPQIQQHVEQVMGLGAQSEDTSDALCLLDYTLRTWYETEISKFKKDGRGNHYGKG